MMKGTMQMGTERSKLRLSSVRILLLTFLWISCQARLAAGQASISERCTSHADCQVTSAISYCVVSTGRCDCLYSPYKHGVFCDKVCTDSNPTAGNTDLQPQCQHGVCIYNPEDILDMGYCNCSNGWTHDKNGLCTKRKCSEPCLNGGHCVADDQCLCSAGTSGRRCEINLNCTKLTAPRHGRTEMRWRGNRQIQIFSCKKGFYVKGDSLLLCKNGKWSSKKPVCADFDECYHRTDDCIPECELCLNNEGSFICLHTFGRAPCSPSAATKTSSMPPSSMRLTGDLRGCAPYSPTPPNSRIDYSPPLNGSQHVPFGTQAKLVCLSQSGSSVAHEEITCGNYSNWSRKFDEKSCGGAPQVDEHKASRGRNSNTIAIIACVVIVCILMPSVCVAVILWYRERHIVHKYSLPQSQNGSESSNSASRSTTSSDSGNGYLIPSGSITTKTTAVSSCSSHIYDAVNTHPVVVSQARPPSQHYAYRDVCALTELQPEHQSPGPDLPITMPTSQPSNPVKVESSAVQCSPRKESLPESAPSAAVLDLASSAVSLSAETTCEYDNEVTRTLPRRQKQLSSSASVRPSRSVSDCLDTLVRPLTSQPPPRKFSLTKDVDMKRQSSIESEYENPEAAPSSDTKRDSVSRTQAALIRNFRRLSEQQLLWQQDSSPNKLQLAPDRTYDSPDSDGSNSALRSSPELNEPSLNGSSLLQEVLDSVSGGILSSQPAS